MTRVLGDVQSAEDAVSDAYAAALERWPREGVPANPAGWIVTVARNRAIDHIRRDRAFEARLAALAAERDTTPFPELDPDDPVPDERLRMVFACCHPAIAPESQVALTLRLVAGLTVGEIARGLLVPEQTVAQRLVRAKRKLRDAGVPFRVPPPHLLTDRLAVALATVYLIYNEGHTAASGDALRRDDLAAEGIRLARLLVELMPDEAEPCGLLALTVLHHARRNARADEHGELVLLSDQDRGRWDQAGIADGLGLTARALRLARPAGAYALQAAIAGEHARAANAADTRWDRIVGLYDRLAEVSPSPVVRLNRAAAISMADGPQAALPLIEELLGDDSLGGYHHLHAAHADMLRRAGRPREAADAYRRALELATNTVERSFLERRLVEVEAADR